MADKIYYTGTSYNNAGARLTVIDEPTKNSIKCRCNICGAEDTYKVSDLKEGKVLACKTCKQGINIGDIFDTLTVKGFLVYDGKLRASVHCSVCDKDLAHEIGLIKSKGYKCPICAKSKSAVAKKTAASVVIKATDKSKNAPKNIIGSVVGFNEEPQMKMIDPGFRGDFIFNGTVSKPSKTGDKVYKLLRGQCVRCGATTTESENYFINHEYKCQKCNKINSDRRNIIENTNWVGYVRHNVEIVRTRRNSNGIIEADTKCLACGDEATMPVVTIFSDPDFVCKKCGDTNVTFQCPLCGKNHIKSTLRNMYKARLEDGNDKTRLTGATCGNRIISYSEVLLQHETLTGLDRVRKKYKGYTLDERLQGHDEVPTIFKFKEGYIGTDGERYHTCMCEVHNKLMVLTDEEIRSYRHEYCADTRMMPYNPNTKPKNRH